MRKYSFTFKDCPVPGCDTIFSFYGMQSEHFRKHLKWELAQGSIALYDAKGLLKAVERRKA